jgi:subtilase family serine protease/methionine-rich copper-binding protein CopC
MEQLEERQLLSISPYPVPLESKSPLGSLIYGSSGNGASGEISALNIQDDFTIDLDGGQSISVSADPLGADLQPVITLFRTDAPTTPLATSVPRSPGENGLLQTVAVEETGSYTIRITGGPANTLGAYHVELCLNAVLEAEKYVPSAGNGTPATAESLDGSFLSLFDGSAARGAVLGNLPAGASDTDFYAFSLTVGQKLNLEATSLSAGQLTLELYDGAGHKLAAGISGNDRVNIDQGIQGYQAAADGTYYAVVRGEGEYSLVALRDLAFDVEPNTLASQAEPIAQEHAVLGNLGNNLEGGSVGGTIRVAILSNGNIQGAMQQLADDTYFNFEPVFVTGSQIDSVEELNAFDVVVLGDYSSRSQLQVAAPALRSWVEAGGGVVGIGWLIYVAGTYNGAAIADIDAIIPVKTSVSYNSLSSPSLTITDGGHPVTAGVDNFVVSGACEYSSGGADAGATVLGTASGQAVVVVGQPGVGRSVYLGPVYSQSDSYTGLKSGEADQLFEQAVAWAARGGVDNADQYSVVLNANDDVTIRTVTPGGDSGEPGNDLDPILELYSPNGTLVASNNNAAGGDGRNSLIQFAVPADASGTYRIRVAPVSGHGAYALEIDGATGVSATTPLEVTSIRKPDGSSLADGLALPAFPSAIRVEFNSPLALRDLSAAALTVNGVPASDVSVIDGRTLEFSIAATNSGDGAYMVEIASGALMNLDGNPISHFARSFTLDSTAPTVIASSVEEGATLDPGSFTYTVTFSEPLVTSGLGAEDVHLVEDSFNTSFSPSSFSYDAATNRITVGFGQPLYDGRYTLTLDSGANALRDLVGNALNGGPSWPLPSGQGDPEADNFVLHFIADAAVSQPYPTPLTPKSPLGSLVFDPQVQGTILNSADSDAYAIALDAGQTATVVATNGAELRGTVELRDSADNLVATATAAAAGQPVILQTGPIAAGDTYRVIFKGEGAGRYTGQLLLNAAVEDERFGGPDNGTIASTPQDLANAFIDLGHSLRRAAVVGLLEASGTDLYRLTLNAGESASIAATRFTSGTLELRLLDEAGAPLAEGLSGYTNVTRAISDFVSPSGGTYYLSIGGQGGEYSLVVTRNSIFDLESNNTTAVAQPMGPFGNVLGYAGDEDRYLLRVNAGDNLQLSLSVPFGDSGEPQNSFSPSLQLFDPGGAEVANGLTISHAALATGNYSVRVSAASGQGSYVLHADGATGGRLFQVVSSTPVSGIATTSFPTTFRINLSEGLLLSSYDAADLQITRPDGTVVPAQSVNMIDGDTLEFQVGSAANGDGDYHFRLAAGTLSGVSSAPLAAFDATVRLDTTGPRVIQTSVNGVIAADGSTFDAMTLTFAVQFNETMLNNGLGVEDVTLVNSTMGTTVNPNAFAFDTATNTATFTFNSVNEGNFVLSLASSSTAFRDALGNLLDGDGNGVAGDPFVYRFTVDLPIQPFTTPLKAVAPDGALIYDATQDGSFLAAAEVDNYSIALDPGQRATIVFTPMDASVQGRVELFDSVGQSLGMAAATAAGQIIFLQSIELAAGAEPQTYRIEATCLSGSGQYRIRLIANAGIEEEGITGVVNNSLAAAQDLTSSAVSLGNAADRLAVVGTIADDADFYVFHLDSGQYATLALASLGGAAGVDLYDSNGNLLASGWSNSTYVNMRSINNFRAPAAGVYYARVTGSNSLQYGLVVSRGADFDREPNNSLVDAQDISYTGTALGGITGQVITSETEPNGSIATANDLTNSFLNTTGNTFKASVTGTISAGGDGDWDYFKIYVSQGDSLTIDLEGSPTGKGTLGDSYLRVFNSAGTQIAYNDDWNTLNSHLSWTNLNWASGEYYVVADSYSSYTGSYTLTVALTTANLTMGGGDDYYRVHVNAGDTLTIRTKTPAGESGEFRNNLDPALTLYDPSGAQIASDDNSSDGRNALLVYPGASTVTGTYTVRVSGRNNSRGDYCLEVSGNSGLLPSLLVASVNPANGAMLSAYPATYRVDLSQPILRTSVQPGDLTISLGGVSMAADSVTVVDADTLEFTISGGNRGDGLYTVGIQAGAITSVSGVPNDVFTATFDSDNTSPRIVASSISEGQIVSPGEVVYQVQFSEELAAANLGVEDVTLVGSVSGQSIAASAFAYDPVTSTATITFANVTEDSYTLTLLTSATAFRDRRGNLLDGSPSTPLPSGDGTAGDNFVLHFVADVTTANFHLPFDAPPPAGSLVFTSSQQGLFQGSSDADAFTIDLDASQTLSVLLRPGNASIQGRLEVVGPDGTSIMAREGEAGEALVLQTLPVTTAGTYTLIATSLNGSGSYELTAVLNAAFEREIAGGSSNDTLADAEPLDGSSVSLLGGADRLAVAGEAGVSGDYYSFALDAGQVASVAAASAAGIALNVRLFDGGGTELARGTIASNAAQVIDGFVAPAAGRYYVRISGPAGAKYNLVVTRSAQFDREPNNSSTEAQRLVWSPAGEGQFAAEVLGGLSAIVRNVEPDDFAADTALTTAVVGVTLTAVQSNGSTSTGEVVRSQWAGGGFAASTGSRVFAHNGTNSWNSSSNWLRADFSQPVREVAIDVIGDDGIDPGVLRAYASNGTLIREVTGYSTAAGNPQRLSIAVDSPSIAYILASGLGGDTATLDNLVVDGDPADAYAIRLAEGDRIEIVTSTPGDGLGQPVNGFDPALLLYNPGGFLVAQDDNSAADGRNARIVYTIPGGGAGDYVLNVRSNERGNYVVYVERSAATGLPDPGPVVVGASPADAQHLASAPLILELKLSETIRSDSVNVADLQFDDAGVTVTNAELFDGTTIRYSMTVPNVEGSYGYRLLQNSLLDLQGTGNLEYRGSFQIDHTGPRVVGQSPALQASAPFKSLTLTFDESLDPAAFSIEDIESFTGPGGVSLKSRITNVTVSGAMATIEFNDQNSFGTYTMVIGPNVTDAVGNLMDQNGNGINGEPGDTYTATIDLQSPDLEVSSVNAPETGVFGQPLAVAWTVRNIGTDPAVEGWSDRIYLSTDAALGADDTLLATVQNLGALNPGEFYTGEANVVLPLNTTFGNGNYYIIVKCDAIGSQPETNEANNARPSDPVHLTLPSIADLVISRIDAPLEALSGQQIPISWTLTNQGTGDATGTIREDVFLSSDAFVGGDQFFGSFEFTGTIHAGESVVRTQTITLPINLQGDRYVIVKTDVNNAIFEHVNENNNTTVDDRPIAVRLSPFPNLQVTAVTAPATGFSSQEAAIEWVITNTGTGATSAPVWYDRVWLSQDRTLDGTDVYLGETPNSSYLAVGESYVNGLTAVLPQGISGNYYFLVRTDYYNQVYEFESENDNTNSGGPTQVELTPPPDLQVKLVNAPSQAFSGQTLPIAWTVENAGPGSTRAAFWRDQVYMSSDAVWDAGDRHLATVDHSGALAPTQNYSASANVTLPIGVSGDFYFFVRTDVYNEVFEHAFETNNTGYDPAPTTVNLTPPPDLEVELVNAPASARAGVPMTVSYRVTNFGSTATPNASWQDRLYLSTDAVFDPASDLYLGATTHHGVLDAGQSADGAIAVTLPNGMSGNYYAFIVTDSQLEVFELNDANNVGFDATPVTVASLPADLAIPSLSAGLSAQAGGAIRVEWNVQNQGVGDTIVTQWTDRVIASADAVPGNGDDIELGSFTHNGLLGVGGSYSRNELVTIPFSLVGQFNLFVRTDVNNQVYESAEGNNSSSAWAVTITRQTPDLQASNVTADPTVLSGTQISVAWTVRNLGTGATNGNWWEDDVYLSADTALDGSDRFLGRVTHSGALEPLGEYNATHTFGLPLDLTGVFHLIVRTDSSNRILEDVLENNNTAAGSGVTNITLSPAPDLTVTDVQAPPVAYSGQTFAATWTVRNVGQAPAAGTSWIDAAYLSLDQFFDRSTDLYVGYRERSASLGVEEEYTATGAFNIPQGLAGVYYVFLVTDANNRVYERGGESNNQAYDLGSMQVNLVPPADLVVGTITVPANGVPGQNASITYTVRNEGTNTAFGNWYDSLYLSADDQWDIGDPLVGRVYHSGDVAGGSSYSHTLTAPLPGVLPGDYHVIIRSDIRNQIAESNETNNVAASLDQAALDAEELALGVPDADVLAQGRSAFYRVDVPAEQAGETLSILFDGLAANAYNELYVSFGQMPSRTSYQFASIAPFSPDQRIVVPAAEAGTYYILAYANNAPSGQDYEITADIVDFSVFDASYGRGGNAGNLTIEVNGAKFDRSVQVRLTDGAGVNRTAVAHHYDTETQLYATLDLKGLTPGQYDVVVENGHGASITVADGLEVVATGAVPQVIPRVQVPSSVRRNTPYQFQVYWGNDGLNDAQAPLLTVGNTVAFGLSAGDYSLGTRYTFLGTNTHGGPAGILRPGQSESMTFFSYSDNQSGDYTAFVDRVSKAPNELFEWQSLRKTLAVADLSSADFDLAFQQLKTQVGPTWGDYLRMLAHNSSLVVDQSADRRDVNLLTQVEWDSAIARVGTSIRGILSSTDGTLELGGLTVWAFNTQTARSFTAVTLKDGSFIVPKVDHGIYRVSVDGAVTVNTHDYEVFDGVPLSGITVDVLGGSRVHGTVRFADGVPLADAHVALWHDGRRLAETHTDIQGRYDLSGLQSGDYILTIDRVGFARCHVSITLSTESQQLAVDAIMRVDGRITGTLVDIAHGAIPVTAATARLVGNDIVVSYYFANVNGSAFSVRGLPEGTYRLTLAAEGFLDRDLTCSVAAGGVCSLGSIEMERSAVIVGHVRSDIAGIQVGGMPIGLYEDDVLTAVATVDAGGDYRFAGLPSGSYSIMLLGHIESGVASHISVAAVAGQTITAADLRIVSGGTIQGVVRRVSGYPAAISGVTVVCWTSLFGEAKQTTTDASGRYAFGDLEPGDYIIAVGQSGNVEARHVHISSPGDDLIYQDIEVRTASSVNGTTRLADGSPVANALVEALYHGQVVLTCLSDANGQFCMDILEPGVYSFRASTAGTTFAEVAIDVTAGVGADVVLTAGTANLSVQLALFDQTTYTDSSVTLVHSSGLRSTVIPNDNGVCLFPRLADGRYSVQVRATDVVYPSSSVTLVAGENATLVLEPQPGYRFDGIVVSTSGDPVTGAIVQLCENESGEVLHSSVTDSTGRYVIEGVAEDDYAVRVLGNGYEPSVIVAHIDGNQSMECVVRQAESSIVGRAKTGNGIVVPYATVVVVNAAGIPIAFGQTDYEGAFMVGVASDENLRVVIACDAYSKGEVDGVNTTSGVANVGDVHVTPLIIETSFLSGSVAYPVEPHEMVAKCEPVANWYSALWYGARRCADEPAEPAAPACDKLKQAYRTAMAAHRAMDGFFDQWQERSSKGRWDLTKAVGSLVWDVGNLGVDLAMMLSPLGKIAKAAKLLENVVGAFKFSEWIPIITAAWKNVSTWGEGYSSGEINLKDALSAWSNLAQSMLQFKADILYAKRWVEEHMEFGVIGHPNFAAYNRLKTVLEISGILDAIGSALSIIDDIKQLNKQIDDAYAEYKKAEATYFGWVSKAQAALAAYEEMTKTVQCDDPDRCDSPNPPDDCEDTPRPEPRDPNDILGPAGFGEEHWVPAARTLDYTIRFENDPVFATAPAQTVRITQQLDADLDPRTFRVGDFGFGNIFIDVPDNRAFYTTRINLTPTLGIYVDVTAGIDVATGQAFWQFDSIDPATGDVPIDALMGFLPPNLTNPDGMGFVTYSVRPRSSATTGTRIDAVATIVFNTNAPMDTPPIFNTLDADAPASDVAVLPSESNAATFTVSWTGADPTGGSGLASYDVWVSDNGGPYALWLERSTLAEASYAGEPGHNYAFYTIVRDNAGNIEAAPLAADATTYVVMPGISVTLPGSLVTTEAGGSVAISLVLTSQPSADVTIAIVSSDTTEGAVSASSVTFTPDNWNVPQVVTITGVDDLIADGTVAYTVAIGPVTSDDPVYAAFDPDDLALVNTDDDPSPAKVAEVNVSSATVNTINVTFTEPMDLARMIADESIVSAVKVINLSTGELPLSAGQFTYDAATKTLHWSSIDPLPVGYYEIRLDGSKLADMAGNLLRGGSSGLQFSIGTFDAAQTVQTGGANLQVDGYSAPALADWNSDGKLDLIVGEKTTAGPGKVRVYLNTGTESSPVYGQFFYVQSAGADLSIPASGCLGAFPRVFDWNQDGKKDLLVGTSDGRILVLQNVNTDANPQFDAAVYLQAGAAGAKSDLDVGDRAAFDIVDWNNDGRFDLVAGGLDGMVRVYLDAAASGTPDLRSPLFALGTGGELAAPSGRSSVAVVDLNGDRRKDLVLGNTEGQLLFYANVGTDLSPVFADPAALTAGGAIIDLAGSARSRPFVGDFNHDGMSDLLVGALDGLVRVYLGLTGPTKTDGPNQNEGATGGDYAHVFSTESTPPAVTVDPLTTNDAKPRLSGTIDDPLATIRVSVHGIVYAATNHGDGTWTLADDVITPKLADGLYDVAVSATDLAGNVGTDTTVGELLIDTIRPNSYVDPLLKRQIASSFVVTVAGIDRVPNPTVTASGIASFDLFVSVDGAPWTLWRTLLASDPSAVYDGASNHSYGFYAVARDAAGNVETKVPRVEGGTYVPDLTPPSTAVTSVSHTTAAFTVNFQGTDLGGSGLSYFDVYVEKDGGPVELIAHRAAGTPDANGTYAGAAFYQAIADGQEHSYRFYTVGADDRGNVESAPDDPNADVLVTAAFTPATLDVTALEVQKGATQRSYIRYLDLHFNQTAGVQLLVNSIHDTAIDRVQLVHYDLNGQGGQRVSLIGKVTAAGNVMAFDFGPNGIGGNRNSTAGDGYYRLLLDLDDDGLFETSRPFYRLLGDVDGNRVVDNRDLVAITAAFGRAGNGLEMDANGDGTVNAIDRLLAARSKGLELTVGPKVTVQSRTTFDSSPAIVGTVSDVLAIIHVTVNGHTYTATNNQNGTWKLANDVISPALADGLYDVVVTAEDAEGNVGSDKTTNELLVDTNRPVSRVVALPDHYDVTAFPVAVVGSDPASISGVAVSGVASYDVFVSVDGQAWTLWRVLPSDNPTALFAGASNHTYAFYSIAWDGAGNTEFKEPNAEAVTYVRGLAPSAVTTAIAAVAAPDAISRIRMGQQAVQASAAGAFVSRQSAVRAIDRAMAFGFDSGERAFDFSGDSVLETAKRVRDACSDRSAGRLDLAAITAAFHHVGGGSRGDRDEGEIANVIDLMLVDRYGEDQLGSSPNDKHARIGKIASI